MINPATSRNPTNFSVNFSLRQFRIHQNKFRIHKYPCDFCGMNPCRCEFPISNEYGVTNEYSCGAHKRTFRSVDRAQSVRARQSGVLAQATVSSPNYQQCGGDDRSQPRHSAQLPATHKPTQRRHICADGFSLWSGVHGCLDEPAANLAQKGGA